MHLAGANVTIVWVTGAFYRVYNLVSLGCLVQSGNSYKLSAVFIYKYMVREGLFVLPVLILGSSAFVVALN